MCLLVTGTVGFVAINFISAQGKLQAFATGVDWRMVPAGLLILFAVWTLAALALACSTRFEMVATLAICSALFLLGLMSPHLFGREGSWWTSLLYTAVPNWQSIWVADVMETEKVVPGLWAYVGKGLVYAVCYSGATLAVALWLFEDRELS